MEDGIILPARDLVCHEEQSVTELSGEGRAGAQPAAEEAEKVPGTPSGHKDAFGVFRHEGQEGALLRLKIQRLLSPLRYAAAGRVTERCPTEPSVMTECSVTLLCPVRQPRATCGYSAPEMWPLGLRK